MLGAFIGPLGFRQIRETAPEVQRLSGQQCEGIVFRITQLSRTQHRHGEIARTDRIFTIVDPTGEAALIEIDLAALDHHILPYVATAAEVDAARARPEMRGIELAVLDVRDDAAVRALVQAQGELDVVVNCAGIIRRGAEHEPEAFAEVLDINAPVKVPSKQERGGNQYDSFFEQ